MPYYSTFSILTLGKGKEMVLRQEREKHYMEYLLHCFLGKVLSRRQTYALHAKDLNFLVAV